MKNYLFVTILLLLAGCSNGPKVEEVISVSELVEKYEYEVTEELIEDYREALALFDAAVYDNREFTDDEAFFLESLLDKYIGENYSKLQSEDLRKMSDVEVRIIPNLQFMYNIATGVSGASYETYRERLAELLGVK